jgi:hypothetical protein
MSGDPPRVAAGSSLVGRRVRTRVSTILTGTLLVGAAILIVAGWDAPPPGTWGFRGFAAILAVAFGGVGAVISSRVPGNRIGELMVAIGLAASVVALCVEYAAYGILTSPGSLPAAHAVAWLVSWVWVPFAALVAPFLLLVFPDGRLLSSRWRPAAMLGAVAATVICVSLAIRPGPINNAPYLDNPLAVPTEWSNVAFGAAAAGFCLLAAANLVAAASLVLRYRQAGGVARQQLKWFAAAATFAGLMLVGPGTLLNIVVTGDPATSSVKAFEVLTIVGFLSIPAATGIAVLRYHLYDIDRVLSRTIAWGMVTVVLALLFAGVVLALQAILAPLTAGNTLAVAASTLCVAGLAQPVTRRTQAMVNRRFFRARYDASRTVDAFAARLREDVNLDSIRSDVLATAGTTMRPAHAGVWIRQSRVDLRARAEPVTESNVV